MLIKILGPGPGAGFPFPRTTPRTSMGTRLTTEQMASASAALAGAAPQEVLRWAVETFYPKLTMATAFGAEGCCLIHMLAEIRPDVRIFNLEMGYQFPETIQLHDGIKQRYGMDVEFVR